MLVLLAWGLVGTQVGTGCSVDLLVGDTDASTGEGTSTGDPTTGPPPDPSTGDDTTVGEPAEGTTTTSGDETSTGEEPEGSGTTTEGVEEGTTTSDEIPCPGLGFLDCNEVPYCLWYGEPEMGECALSPCEDPMDDCWEVPFEDCEAAPGCAWVGEPKMGECAPIECVPCEILGFEQCTETPTCEWLEMKKACVS